MILEEAQVTRNTRVYFKDIDLNIWCFGRVLKTDGTSLECSFVNSHPPTRYYETSEIFVRWNKDINDPSKYLGGQINDLKYPYDQRLNYQKNIITQRSSSFGISALLPSIINLEPHQIEVVNRVLQDPIQRYLLADEVGLGKTIEAGIIIKQFVLDYPNNHKTLIIVPNNLLKQWEKELTHRFLLGNKINFDIFILSFDQLDEIKKLSDDVSMVVIDEVHHINRSDYKELYDFISNNYSELNRFLLLSATPVLNNEKSFFEILHLLDPITYGLESFENFQKLIANRQILLETIALMEPDNKFVLEDPLINITEMFPNDHILLSLIDTLIKILKLFPKDDDPDFTGAMLNLKNYLAEAYKLDRRILRNRRDNLQKGLTAERFGVKIIPSNVTLSKELFILIENLRIQINSDFFNNQSNLHYLEIRLFFIQIIKLFCQKCHYNKILNKFEANIHLFEDQYLEFFNKIKNQILLFENNDELFLNLLNYINECDKNKKIIIFCSDTDVVFDLDAFLNLHYKGGEILNSKMKYDDNNFDLNLHFNENKNSILICDKNAEEGLNLDGSERVLVHFDLPLNPNRIEQRIGRIDRYRSQNFQNVVLLNEDNPYEKEWFDLLNSSLKLFDKSVASLQFVIDDLIGVVESSIFENGSDIIFETKEKIINDSIIENELKKIGYQDQLDTINQTFSKNFDQLLLHDENWHYSRQVLFKWLINVIKLKHNIKSFKLLVKSNSPLLTLDDFFKFCKSNNKRKLPITWSSSREANQYFSSALENENIYSRFKPFNQLDMYIDLINNNIDVFVVNGEHYRNINLKNIKALEDGVIDGAEVFRFIMDYQTLIPLDTYANTLITTIDKSLKNSNRDPISSYEYTFRRESALRLVDKNKEIKLLRYGDDFIDGVDKITKLDDRGKSFAVFRFNRDYTAINDKIDYFFVFNFLIEANIEDAVKSFIANNEINLNGNYVSNAYRRLLDFHFNCFSKTVWLDQDLEEVHDKSLLNRLEQPFKKYSKGTEKGDWDLDPVRWKKMNKIIVNEENWKDLVAKGKTNAENIITNSMDLKETIKNGIFSLEKDFNIRKIQSNARLQSMTELLFKNEKDNLQYEKTLFSNFKKGIQKPLFQLDSVGVIFLSNLIFEK